MHLSRQPSAVGLFLIGVLLFGSGVPAARADSTPADDPESAQVSSFWRPAVRQWSKWIVAHGETYGVDPELMASVIEHESHGDPTVKSRMGAVGPMQIMPFEAGFVNRPSEAVLSIPSINISWGAALLADILRQTRGDAFMAAEAYAGGWGMVGSKVTRRYAMEVITDYALAVAWNKGVILDPADPSWGILVTGHDRDGRSILRVIRGGFTDLDSYGSLEEMYANVPGLRPVAVQTSGRVTSAKTGQQVMGLIYVFLPPRALPATGEPSGYR